MLASDESASEDLVLFDRVRGSDEDAIRSLMSKYGGLLHSRIIGCLHDRDTADEVLNSFWAWLWNERCKGFDARFGKPLGWMMVTVSRRAIDAMRKARSRGASIDRYEESRVNDDDFYIHDFDNVGLLEEITAALGALPPLQRAAVEQWVVYGMSHRDTDSFLGVPLGTIKTRIELGLRKLRHHPTILRITANQTAQPNQIAMIEQYKVIAARLTSVMEERGITISQTAQKCELSYGTIDTLLKARTCTDNTIQALCRGLDLRYPWLKFGEGPKSGTSVGMPPVTVIPGDKVKKTRRVFGPRKAKVLSEREAVVREFEAAKAEVDDLRTRLADAEATLRISHAKYAEFLRAELVALNDTVVAG